MAKYRSNYSKKPLIIAGAARLGVIALAAALVITGVVGLSSKADGSDGIQVGISSVGVVGFSDNASLPPEPTSPPLNGGNDSKLVGVWVRNIHSDYRYFLSFKDDGSYSYVQISGSTITTVKGSYTTSNGRVYLTNLVDDREKQLKDQSMGYSFGIDSDGEYLSIATILIIFAESDDEPKEGTPTQFWRS